MMTEFEGICDEASAVDDIETVDLVISSLQQLRFNVKESRQKFVTKQAALPTLPATHVPPSEIGSNSLPNQVQTPCSVAKDSSKATAVKDPLQRRKPRGRPKTTRYKSAAEKGYKTQKSATNSNKTQQGKRKRTTRPLSAVYEDCIDPDMLTDSGEESEHSFEF